MPTLFLVKSVILGKILSFPVAQFPQLKNELDRMIFKVLAPPPLIDWQHKFSKYENMSHRLQPGLSQKSRCMLALHSLPENRWYLSICYLREGKDSRVYYFYARVPGCEIKASPAPNQIIPHALSCHRDSVLGTEWDW